MALEAGVQVRDTELIGGIAMPYLLAALNEAIHGDIRPTQVLDAWLPASYEG